MFNTVTLEMSLKPFKQTDEAYIKKVCSSLFEQWKPLIKNTDTVAVLLWSADGSELLDYRGNVEDSFEWAKWIGGANSREGDTSSIDPEGVCLHSRCYEYTDNTPIMTYKTLKMIVSELKNAGRHVLGNKRIIVGSTFDPGPEFAKSSFKYERHNEICTGNDMGVNTFVSSYSVLKGDDVCYAGYPNGIPDGTPFGEFLGVQAERFLKDMGFDYLWLSNGFGFGREPWSAVGAVFDGHKFKSEDLCDVKQSVLDFWKLFRKNCPDIPIQTRGTNMSMGIDLATDGVPLKDIYDGGFDILPPPNSPWAALNGDFGLELMGYMSRIAYLPDEFYLFRYYVHDPWWANSPWYDRYNSMPHDIYLPMSICRINEAGRVFSPSHLNILTVDNSFGDMPDYVPCEVIPHINKAIREAPDMPSPVVWIYPFEEYSNCADEKGLSEMYSQDWFIRGAINNGLPLSSVTSTTDFIAQDKRIYLASVLVSPVPKAGSRYERTIIDYVGNGGKVIFYGNTENASEEFLKTAGIRQADEVSGVFEVNIDGRGCGVMNHREFVCAGGINATAAEGEPIAFCGGKPVIVKNNSCVWVRGTVSANIVKGQQILKADDANDFFIGESLMLKALALLGMGIEFENPENKRKPVIMLHRHDNAFVLSAFLPSTTVKTKLRFEYGIPVLNGYETRIENGFAAYNFPKCVHCECRVFVEQESGVVGCREVAPVDYRFKRRVAIYGLKNATVRFLAQEYCKRNVTAALNSDTDFYEVSDRFEYGYKEINGITFFEARNITGELVVSMPNRGMHSTQPCKYIKQTEG